MHKIVTSIRRIAPAELPTITPIGEATRPMNDQELLNAGIQHLSGDYYSCIHQEERDDDTLQWSPKEGQSLPGTVVTEGFLQQRHAELPDDVKGQILRASVIRSKDSKLPADDLASAALIEASGAAAKAVGTVNGAPLLDVAHPDLLIAEAQRLVAMPDSTLERKIVAMDAVVQGDVVELDGIYPHSWSGEPRR